MKESDHLVLTLFSACFLSKGRCIPFLLHFNSTSLHAYAKHICKHPQANYFLLPQELINEKYYLIGSEENEPSAASQHTIIPEHPCI